MTFCASRLYSPAFMAGVHQSTATLLNVDPRHKAEEITFLSRLPFIPPNPAAIRKHAKQPHAPERSPAISPPPLGATPDKLQRRGAARVYPAGSMPKQPNTRKNRSRTAGRNFPAMPVYFPGFANSYVGIQDAAIWDGCDLPRSFDVPLVAVGSESSLLKVTQRVRSTGISRHA